MTSLEGILKSKAAEGVWLLPDTYKQWGQIPGSLNVTLNRKYTFYNFTNPFEVFYFNETPKFVQTTTHTYQEYQNLTDVKYSYPDKQGRGTVVDFNYQLYNLEAGASPDDVIQTINLGALGCWYSAHNLPDNEFGSFTLASLVRNLEDSIPTTLLASAIKVQCLEDETKAQEVLSKSRITDPALQSFIWDDPVYGIKDRATLALWVHAIAGGPESGAGKILAEYFTLTHSQLVNLIGSKSELVTCVKGINDTVTNGYHCPTYPCTAEFLTFLQWATQQVTKHPAGGILPEKDSVTFYNRTVTGLPEISYFLKDYFIPHFDVNPEEYKITFTTEMTYRLLNSTPSDDSGYCKNPDTLLHFGNHKFIYDIGNKFEAQENKRDLTVFQPMKERFGLPTLKHAHVIWKYLVYFSTEFIQKQSIGGSKAYSILGTVVSKVMFETYITAVDFVLPDLTARIIESNMTNSSIDCVQLFEISTGIDNQEALAVCLSESMNPFNLSSIGYLVTICSRQGGEEYNNFMEETGLTVADMANLCTATGKDTFASMMQASQLYLKDHYECFPSIPKAKKCSNQEIAFKQWRDSSITRNVPPVLAGTFEPSDSLVGWYPEKFEVPFEYMTVLNLLKRNLDESDLQPIEYETVKKLLTFDGLFSPVLCQVAFNYFDDAKWEEFDETFYGVKPYPLILYFRYLVMDVGLKGFSQTKTVGELLWGYTDPFLEGIQKTHPLESGNPSLNPVVSLAGANSSFEDAKDFPMSMYTGVNETQKTRKIRSFMGSSDITFPTAYFNGNESVSQLSSPWKESIPINGSDGSINNPGLSTNQKVPLFIGDLSYQTDLEYSGNKTSYNGVNGYRYVFGKDAMKNKTNNPNNEVYFADRWDGLINASLLHSAPLYVSKSHFLDVDPYLLDAVEVYDSEGNKTKPTSADDFYMDIEPYSGVALGVSGSFQANYYLKADELFKIPNEAMLPIVIIQRGFNMKNEQVDAVFSDLRLGLSMKSILPWVSFIIAILLVVLGVFLFRKRKEVMLAAGRNTQIQEEGSYHRAEDIPEVEGQDQQ